VDGDAAAVWRVRGEPLAPPTGSGPLDGLTVAVKDLFAVTGFAVGGGNPQWLAEALPSAADAPSVAALRAAGAAVAGIAQTDELAYSLSGANVHYGTPPNPAAPDRVTGGSSNGPASAVALGEADIGLGTDTGGSIRVPASCCGLYGLRPTHGVIDNTSVLPLAPSFDTVGWMTRDAGTLRLVGAVLLPDGPTDLPARVLLVRGTDPVDAAVTAAAEHWGATVEPIEWPGDVDAMLAAFRAVQAAEGWRNHGAWIEAHPRALALDIEGRYRYGSTVDDSQEAEARAAIAAWRASLLALLGDDAWLALPAAGGPGHLRDVSAEAKTAWRQSTLRCTVPASACGLPSVSIPTGASPPIGMAFIGPPGSDRALLEASFLG
jgi:Asp-tRNA(Asn)/Glu-tRNA(Gln) amidotransferase A subunit family amidase